MQVGLFGKKVGMTQIFDNAGQVLPVTILKMESCQVTQIKTNNTDGYTAVQIGYNQTQIENLNKPTTGHLQKSSAKGFKSFGEFRVDETDGFKLGQTLTVDSFSVGQKVRITGRSIGKGF